MARKFKLPVHSRRLLALVLLFVFLGIGLYFTRYHKTTSTIPSVKEPVVNVSTLKSTSATTPVDTPKTSTGGAASSPTASSTSTLAAPYGSFVSSHKPNANSTEESGCTTTAGATCFIQFTKGSVVKKLDAQVVNSSGTSYWIWQVDKAGLDVGSWQITAVASLNGQTKTTVDQLPLEVHP